MMLTFLQICSPAWYSAINMMLSLAICSPAWHSAINMMLRPPNFLVNVALSNKYDGKETNLVVDVKYDVKRVHTDVKIPAKSRGC